MRRHRLLIAASIMLLFTLGLSLTAQATWETNDDPDPQQQQQSQGQDQEQEQDQDQLQLQDQSQGQTQRQDTAQANQQNISFQTQAPGRAYVAGGDSTADDQKVFAISGGWLTGAAGIRLDITDKGARQLRIANQWRMDGRVSAADRLECSVRAINKAFGGPDECWTALSSSQVTRLVDGEKALKQAELDELRQELEALKRQIQTVDEGCDRRWETCVTK